MGCGKEEMKRQGAKGRAKKKVGGRKEVEKKGAEEE